MNSSNPPSNFHFWGSETQNSPQSPIQFHFLGSVMASHNQVEAVLPVEIIQEIQSRLTRREGSVSACISTSWNNAWLSRADAVFDARDFRVNGVVDTKRFCKYVEKIITRQEAGKYILKALELGAVNIEFETGTSALKLFPQEVLGSQNPVELPVIGCWKASLSSLKSLSLCKVGIQDDRMLSDILSSCPLIEKLVFSTCNFSVQFHIPNLANTLKYLMLKNMVVSREFYNDFLSKFPCLKALDVRHCTEFTDSLLITCPTLESIHFRCRVTLSSKFHVPNSRKFSFVGTKVPCLIFEGARGEWESDLSIRWQSLRDKWFRKLNALMLHLSEQQSKITSLSLVLGSMKVKLELKDVRFPNVFGLHNPIVESLKIRVDSSMSYGIMDALIQAFHLKSIYFMALEEKSCFYYPFFRTLVIKLLKDGSIPNSNRYYLGYLVGVDLEFYNGILGEFQPLTWKMMERIDVSVPPEIQFRLNLQFGMKS